MTAADLVAAYAIGLCPVIPSGTYYLPSSLVLGAWKNPSDHSEGRWERLVARAEGGVTLIAPEGQPTIQVYGRYHKVENIEGVGNGAEVLKLGDNADDYVGSNFHGENLILRGGTVGFFNGKFDASSLRDSIIQACGVGAHITGNQDATGLDSVTINDNDLALWVNKGGVCSTEEGVFANNKLCVRAGSTDAGDSGEVIMQSPRFEFLRGSAEDVPAAAGSAFLEAVANSNITVDEGRWSPFSGNDWLYARGGPNCKIVFRGGNPGKCAVSGDGQVLADDILRVPVNYNGVATYIARSSPIEFV